MTKYYRINGENTVFKIECIGDYNPSEKDMSEALELSLLEISYETYKKLLRISA